MSLQLDWGALKPFIENKLATIIENVPADVNAMLTSSVKLLDLDLGNTPPLIALTRINSLSMREQKINAVFRYKGSARLCVLCNLNVNALSACDDHHEPMRAMGLIYTKVPLDITCRFLLSNFDLLFKISITHTDAITYIEFEEPPSVALLIDSNLSKLGPIFESATKRIEKIVRKAYASFPDKIEIPIPKPQQNEEKKQ